MSKNYIDPFLNATTQVFQNMLQLSITPGEVVTREDLIPTKQVNVSIGVTGNLKGSVLFSFSKEMALRMVSEMAGMKMEEVDKFVTSAVGELANIISGQAMTHLHAQDYVCDIVPPQVMVGTDIQISMPTDEIVSLALGSDFGEFEIHLSLEE